MKWIKSKSNNPYFNLALEEYLLKHKYESEDILYFWINEPTVVIGRNQNAMEEINKEYTDKEGINIVRRMSGGGAVFHDFGNLNYTFITSSSDDCLNNYKKFTDPVIRALNKMGILAEFSGRNDIVVDGKKISGNAQYYYKDRMFHHGTLLYNANLLAVKDALNVKQNKLISKGVKSVAARVTNISNYVTKDMDTKEFRDVLLDLMTNDGSEEVILNEFDINEIEKLSNQKYSSWDWIYGVTPKFDVNNTKRFSGGEVQVLYSVKNGKFYNVKIYGDFLSSKNTDEIISKIIGSKYDKKTIEKIMDNVEYDKFFPLIKKDELMELMFNI